jgi:glutamate--cysteine ligase
VTVANEKPVLPQSPLYSQVEKTLASLIKNGQSDLLSQNLIGLEKETLRVNAEGGISQTAHPASLGSALTNPYITTDYSEALIEFITPPFADMGDALGFLCNTQRFVYENLTNELLWATSMPCVVAGETSIPIAQYGKSQAGMMKHIYRRGLAHRYGRVMQVIAGVHYNFSFTDDFWESYQQFKGDTGPLQDFISEQYFGMLRNLQRLGWLIPYLFGASPAVCKSFLGGASSTLHEFDANTFYEPYATSLRMGDIGYQNNKENEFGIKASYDSINAYIESLRTAIATPCKEYEKIGVKVDGEYRQLNSNILQIENEYYSTVRPKRVLQANEMPTIALKRRGVQYIELRSLDVNAFDPLGINAQQLLFLESLMVFCLLDDSPVISDCERREIDQNELLAAHRGREPGLMLSRNNEQVTLLQWADEVCSAMYGICEQLDKVDQGSSHVAALKQQHASVRDPQLTPSARMLAEMRENREGFYHFAKRMSRQHFEYFHAMQLEASQREFFASAAAQSLQAQNEIEIADKGSFEDYLSAYFTQS